MEIGTPESLRLEHQELHEELARATKVPGRIGEAAKAVAAVLHSHFVKEEQYAMPPLSLLSALADGRISTPPPEVLEMSRRLKADLPQMLAEHRAIVAALDRLKAVAREEGQAQYERFAEKLALHAKTEEEVLYPAAILVGKFLQKK